MSEIRDCVSESPLCSDSKSWEINPFLEIPCNPNSSRLKREARNDQCYTPGKTNQPGEPDRVCTEHHSHEGCCRTAAPRAVGWWRTVVEEGGGKEPGLFQQGIIQENEDGWGDFTFLPQPPLWDSSYQGPSETEWDQHLLPVHFHFVYVCVLLSGRNVFCMPDRDNEIHSGQAEWGWWVRHPRQPKSRHWLCTGSSPMVPHHCHTCFTHRTQLPSASSPVPPADPFSSPLSSSWGNQSALRKMQLIILGLAQSIQNPFLIRVFHIKLVW